ncbi:hypothetical protein PSTG_10508 [Puccinia striiformis f. sp. tritici PST-78]|uniref:Uncharacterized protein n=1 Tax=Puccinia striiformis f. sp. tritici PST-78 TaxID=1165861 RepID=A0A0L0VAK1_9BASI|nr:hypothetical protein PSTG_10508 [Puccinia striiformis f. sp. tritici PST-78]
MLDQSILRSRPRPPARRSFSQKQNNQQQPATATTELSSSPSSGQAAGGGTDKHVRQTTHDLTDSPLSTVARILQERSPGGLEFKSSDSFIDAWSYHNNQEQEEEEEEEETSDYQPPQERAEPVQREAEDQEQKSITHEWVGAKTREELENLLLAADRVIRERERDLGIAASIGKSLLENNIALRARQEKLLAQVSGSLPPSPTYHNRELEDITNRSEYIEGRPPPSPSDYDPHDLPFELSLTHTQSPAIPIHRAHHPIPHTEPRATPAGPANRFPYCLRAETSPRSSISSVSSSRKSTISSHLRQQPASASPATLHRLAQQNEFLAEQLADLQAETAESELEGRKRLRKLVKELETLRADLRQTEERNALLEEERMAHLEQQTPNVGDMVDVIVGDMKRVMMEDPDPTLKTPARSTANFAQTFSSSPIVVPDQQTTPTTSSSHSPANHPQSHTSSHLSLSSRRSTISNLSRSSREFQSSPQERAVVSQLLTKIAELKESQNQFDHEREEMKAKLRKAREEVVELQLLVEDAESELQQVRELGWEDRRGLIEWDGAPDRNSHLSGNASNRKASGNRKMINQSRKAKKRHWPAPEHQPGSIGSDITIPESHPSSMYGLEPHSPSMRGQALSMARLNTESTQASPVIRSKYSQLSKLQVSSTSSFETSSEAGDGGSIPLRTLLSEMGGQYPEVSSPEARSPTVNGVSHHQPHKKDGSIDHLRPPVSRRMTQPTYTELQRAVAETPLMWADDKQSGSGLNESQNRLANERKRDSTEWLYSNNNSSLSHPVDSWSATSSTSLGIMAASRPKANLDSILKTRQHLLIQARGEALGGDYLSRSSSILSGSSTTIGRVSSPSERTATTSKSELSSNHSTTPNRNRSASRREEALRRLGIPSSTDTCSSTSEYESERGHSRRARGEEEEEEGSVHESEGGEESLEEPGNTQQETEWNYIDSTDHDNLKQGSTGTDYFPISLRARNAPGMVVGRLQAKGAGWGTFVYQWMKLVSVVGLAVGWAVWQGPRTAMEDEYPFAQNLNHNKDHEDVDDDDEEYIRNRQRLAIEHNPINPLRNSVNRKLSNDNDLTPSSSDNQHNHLHRSASGHSGSASGSGSRTSVN